MTVIRDIVIGDVHGCLEELDELLRTIEYTTTDRLVFVGDLVDRGPDSAGMVRRVRELSAICVMGNHDEWYRRNDRHEAVRLSTGKKNPMRKNPEKEAIYAQLSAVDLAWLAALPLYYRLDEHTVVVHAGMSPGIPVEKQPTQSLLRMRYLRRATGQMWNMASEELLTPDVAAYWTEVWTGPDDVVYGHHPSKTDTVVTEHNGVRCWGIDTGCCFGNKLTAWVRTDGDVRLVSVPARAQYSQWHHSMGEN